MEQCEFPIPITYSIILIIVMPLFTNKNVIGDIPIPFFQYVQYQPRFSWFNIGLIRLSSPFRQQRIFRSPLEDFASGRFAQVEDAGNV